ncbi:MAG: YqaJ viral recombinase family protein [Candidatus Sabulitectum sp.]|nr:YqaJ viral recombinase family protein [Candidatus Sabulitectum sp.]
MIPDLPRIRKSKNWHLQRMKGIGGSDWAAILSDHYPHEYKWSCLRRLYYTKKGIKPDFPEKTSRAAKRGNILEPVVAELFKAHTGCTFTEKVPRAKELYPGKSVPEWWIGNPDYIAVMPGDKKLQGLECKTMNSFVWKQFIENGLSTSYQIQPQHYIGLTGLDVFHVAVMWPDGLEFQTEPVPRNEEMLRLMVDAGEWFMKKILIEGKAPEHAPVSEQRCAGCMYAKRCLGQSYYEKHELDLTDLSSDEHLYDLLNQLEKLKADKTSGKAPDELQDKIKDHIRRTHGDNIEWFFCREHEVAWKKSMGSRFQKDQLLADEPSLAPKLRAYTKFFPRRTFTPRITKKSVNRWETMRAIAG